MVTFFQTFHFTLTDLLASIIASSSTDHASKLHLVFKTQSKLVSIFISQSHFISKFQVIDFGDKSTLDCNTTVSFFDKLISSTHGISFLIHKFIISPVFADFLQITIQSLSATK
jgi:hypothetical protein